MNVLLSIWDWISPKLTLNNIILFILGLDTIRMIIGAMGIVNEDGRFSRIVYGKKRPATIKAALLELGYTEQQSDNRNAELSRQVVEEKLSHKNNDWCYRELIKLIKRCMVKADSEVSYGANTTEYYIDTMSGIRNLENRVIMRDLMLYLLKSHKKLKSKFIVTPKNGNPTFGTGVASSLGAPLLLHKHSNDPSRVRTNETENYARTAKAILNINFEGASYLDFSKNQNGIIVDCNTSSGSQIIEAGVEFNELIKLQPGVDKTKPMLKCAFALFRVDDDNDFYTRFQESGIEFRCILMLSEEIKREIYELSESPTNAEVNSIIEKLSHKKSLYLPISTMAKIKCKSKCKLKCKKYR